MGQLKQKFGFVGVIIAAFPDVGEIGHPDG
jgi:hypothetical protein